MTATDIMRRLLDERGVEWEDHSGSIEQRTVYMTPNGWCYVSTANDKWLSYVEYHDMTPEQVAAGGRGPSGQPGTGGPGYSIKGEWRTNPNNSHEDGALAMARSSAPDSAGSQFYFCLGEQHFLDPNYTVFGQTLEGFDVIAAWRAGDVIEHIEIENAAE